ncbi:MAG: ABC transporter substrate-binding protein, partial [Leptolyngbyaceae cyanobacterium bins.59]|nr:ABC transporter substrate-binding protein [Leptolyngbyaceae cyanobacterium bins.59]
MKRRNLLGYAATGVGSAAALSACNKATTEESRMSPGATPGQPTIRWRMATSWPKSLDIAFGTAELVCQKVSDMTKGRFVITPYEAGEIVPGLEVLDAISAGTAECGHTASYYFVKKNPALAFGTTIPFGLNAQQQNAWLNDGGGLDLIRKLYADFGVVTFPGGSTGAQMGGWFTRSIRSVQDLKGLKMRIPGMGGQVMKRLGVDVQVLAGNEIFGALETKRIDAAEWVGPYEDERLGLNRIAPFYYYPGWWEPGT